jgi:hypothetical protein
MKTKLKQSRRFLLGALLALTTPFAVRAADHGDAPTASLDQSADIADVFFFLDPNDNNNAILIATVHGFIVPGEAVNFGIFDPGIRYRLALEINGDAQADKFIDVTFSPRTGGVDEQNTADGEEALEVPFAQTATVKLPKLTGFNGGTFTNLPVLNPNLTTGTPNTPGSTDIASTGIKFFAGEVDDPFFFDIPGFSRFIASIRTTGTPDVTRLDRGRDSFAGYNILAIALSIPKAMLKKNSDVIGVRFLTQRRTETATKKGTTLSEGAFRTVDSMGNPAVNVALIPFSKKNKYNGVEPSKAVPNKLAGDIVRTLAALGLPTDEDPPNPNFAALAAVAVNAGDYLRLDLSKANTPADKVGGGDPTAPNGFPNGRRLRDDTVDILLNIITQGAVSMGDHTNSSISQFPQTATFPFLAPAQQPVNSADPTMPFLTDDKTQN